MKDFKIVFMPNMDNIDELCEYITYADTFDDAIQILNTIADYTLLLHECSLMPDYSNMGMLFKKVDKEWIEINDDGEEI